MRWRLLRSSQSFPVWAPEDQMLTFEAEDACMTAYAKQSLLWMAGYPVSSPLRKICLWTREAMSHMQGVMMLQIRLLRHQHVLTNLPQEPVELCC